VDGCREKGGEFVHSQGKVEGKIYLPQWGPFRSSRAWFSGIACLNRAISDELGSNFFWDHRVFFSPPWNGKVRPALDLGGGLL